ncbi:MAG: patatin-like phospholipase family protein [Hyphomicrobiales bacterium]|nr:patatin-like phospholipase family protein [Hyphomicrobiales bacterium]
MRFLQRLTYDKVHEGKPGGSPKPKLGFAIGGGAARGWAHIGVLRTLDAAGIRPDIISGTSVGAVVGGCYAAGQLKALENFARGLTKRRVFSLMDLTFSGAGLVAGGRLKSRLDKELGGQQIEDLGIAFTAVATEMGTGHEIWLDRGGLSEAIRASFALPGIFEPMKINGRWLFDGALVNPVPVTVCRAKGASFVIALNLNSELRRPAGSLEGFSEEAIAEEALDAFEQQAGRSNVSLSGFLPSLRGRNWLFRRQFATPADGPPGIATAMVDAFNITQDRITRSRLAGDPPDISINIKLGDIGFFDFHRAAEMIELGRDAARRALPEIQELLKTPSHSARP